MFLLYYYYSIGTLCVYVFLFMFVRMSVNWNYTPACVMSDIYSRSIALADQF